MASSSDTVTVYSKYPSNIILRAQAQRKVQESAPGGTKEVDQYFFIGDGYEINGVASPFGRARTDCHTGEFVTMIAGYAVTRGVPRELWENWWLHNADSELVRNHIIYSPAKGDDHGWAKEHVSARSNMEPLIPPDPTTADGRSNQRDPRLAFLSRRGGSALVAPADRA